MATHIERAAAVLFEYNTADARHFIVRDGGYEGIVQALLDAGWTLIPPATDDLPEGWEWRLARDTGKPVKLTAYELGYIDSIHHTDVAGNTLDARTNVLLGIIRRLTGQQGAT